MSSAVLQRSLESHPARRGKVRDIYDLSEQLLMVSTTGWDKNSEPPELPADVVAKTREKYTGSFEQLTDQVFAWK